MHAEAVTPIAPSDSDRQGLTDREAQIVALVVDGLTNPAIGDALGISARTAQSHVAAAMRKLEARTRTQLAVTALRSGLVPLRPGD
jgi:DNA-binding NarL/FixJ family response regulator